MRTTTTTPNRLTFDGSAGDTILNIIVQASPARFDDGERNARCVPFEQPCWTVVTLTGRASRKAHSGTRPGTINLFDREVPGLFSRHVVRYDNHTF